MGEIMSFSPVGIVRNTPNSSSKDGALLEAINMRYKDGAWRGVGDKVALSKQIKTTDPITNIYYHPALPDDYYVAYNTETSEIVLVNGVESGYSTQTLIISISGETLNGFDHLDRFLLIFTETNAYTFFLDTSNTYIQLDKLPTPIFQPTQDNLEELSYTAPSTNYPDTAYEESDMEQCISEMIKLVSEKRAKGKFSGHVLIQLAWKLFDGTYILQSQPFYWHVGFNCATNSIPALKWYTTNTFDCVFVARLLLYYHFKDSQITTIQSYIDAGLIQSMCVFMTREIPSHDIYVPFSEYVLDSGAGVYHPPSNQNKITKIYEQGNYYLIHEIQASDIITTPSGSIAPDLTEIDNITTFTPLTINEFSHHTLTTASSYQYNARLHLNGVKAILPNMGDAMFHSDFYDAGTKTMVNIFDAATTTLFTADFPATAHPTFSSTYTLYWYIEVKTANGIKTVLQEVEKTQPLLDGSGNITGWDYKFYEDTGDYYLIFKQFLGFPDYRGVSVKLYVCDPTQVTNSKLVDTYTLAGSSGINYAVIPTPYNDFAGSDLYNGVFVPVGILFDDTPTLNTTLPSEDRIINEPNRLQVSQQNNPISFPAKNSYRIGNPENEIIASIAQVDAISEGQFGQFPLYVFTNSGIFTLSQGSGDVLYSNILPLNNEVLINKRALVQVKNSIAFATQFGIRLISGREMMEISQSAEGTHANPISALPHFITAISDAKLPQMSEYLTDMPFLTFIQDCCMGYDAENNELIISRYNTVGWDNLSKYSYTYNFYTQSWATRGDSIAGTVVIGGKMYGIKRTLLRVGSVSSWTMDTTAITLDSSTTTMDVG